MKSQQNMIELVTRPGVNSAIFCFDPGQVHWGGFAFERHLGTEFDVTISVFRHLGAVVFGGDIGH